MERQSYATATERATESNACGLMSNRELALLDVIQEGVNGRQQPEIFASALDDGQIHEVSRIELVEANSNTAANILTTHSQ
ncbi:hypothetical protein [Granulicella sp. L60]|uniref:hypothetical protein n=1 Tax=Granulicella sp. L60 TaxID=1641866 RepID=UPI00131CB736|nr:hypothetical protein [Granulicella sp. L60]